MRRSIGVRRALGWMVWLGCGMWCVDGGGEAQSFQAPARVGKIQILSDQRLRVSLNATGYLRTPMVKPAYVASGTVVASFLWSGGYARVKLRVSPGRTAVYLCNSKRRGELSCTPYLGTQRTFKLPRRRPLSTPYARRVQRKILHRLSFPGSMTRAQLYGCLRQFQALIFISKSGVIDEKKTRFTRNIGYICRWYFSRAIRAASPLPAPPSKVYPKGATLLLERLGLPKKP